MDEKEYIKLFERLWNKGGTHLNLLEASLKAEKQNTTFKHEDLVIHFHHKGIFDVFLHLFMKKDCRIVLVLLMGDCSDCDIVDTIIHMSLFKENQNAKD